MRATFALILAASALAGCKAPIPDRAQVEADAAWNAGEWRDDYGGLWRVRTNSRRVSATQIQPDTGVTLRGAIDSGALSFSMLDRGGQEIGKGEAKVVDASHALFHVSDMTGKEISHGLWHFDHMPGGPAPAATPIPTPIALPSVTATPTPPAPAVSAPVPPSATAAPGQTTPPPPETLTPTPAPTTPAKPGDPLDLRPH